MQNGLYKVTFSTPLGVGFGVVYAHNGELHGGDTMMYYIGSYSSDGNKMTAEVQVDAHSQVPGMGSVLGAQKATLSLRGTFQGGRVECQGTSPQAPGLTFKATLDRIAE